MGSLTAATAAAAGAADLSPTGRELYRQRNVVEGPLALPKQWRGLVTRYDKHAQIYGGPSSWRPSCPGHERKRDMP
jgi:transposase